MLSRRVTIVTLYYNRSENVGASVQSLLNQDYEDYHVIALDDGSTDDTFSKLQALIHPRLTTVTHPNMGFTPSIAKLFSEIDSEFIAVHGSGDFSAPSRLRRQVEALDRDSDAVMVVTANRTIDPKSMRPIGARTFPRSILTRADIASTTPFTHGTVMYRRAAYEKAGGYEPAIQFCSDWDLWFRLLELGHAVYINDPIYDRLAQEDGASFSPRKAVAQVRCKRLAIKLSRCSPTERESVLAVLRTEGLRAATISEAPLVARDLARRHVKLELMGRSAEADLLRQLVRDDDLDYPGSYKLITRAARFASRSGLDPERLIRWGRHLIKR